MAANHSPGESLSPFERRRLDELRRHLESDDPRFAAALTEQDAARGNPAPRTRSRARSVVLAVLGVLAIAVVVLGAVVMFGFASVGGVLCSAFTMYGIFKLCSAADRSRHV